MDEIPLLCLDLIAQKVLVDLPPSLHHIAAAHMSMVGNADCTRMAHMMWETLEPGCTARAHDEYEVQQAAWESCKNSSSRIADEVARYRLCIQNLNVSIQKSFHVYNEEIESHVQNIKKKSYKKPSFRKCLLSLEARDAILARVTKASINNLV